MTSITTESIVKRLKTIPRELLLKDQIPLFGGVPCFPWTELSKELENNLHLKEISLSPSKWQWRTKEQLLEDFSDAVIPFTFSIPPLEGELTLLIGRHDLHELYNTLIFNGSDQESLAIDQSFEKAFCQFLFIEAADAVKNSGFNSNLAPQLHTLSQLPEEAMFCSDLSFSIHKKETWIRLLISEKLLLSAKQHWAENERKQLYSTSIAEQIQVTLQIEGGRLEFPQKEWQKVRAGDFLILDNCSLKQGSESCKVLITVNNIPLFVASKEGQKIKIIEHPNYEEVNMTKNPDEESEEEFEDDESEFENDDEFEDEDEEEFEEEDEEDEEEFEDEDEEEFEEEDEEELSSKPAQKTSTEASPVAAQAATPSPVIKEGPFSIDKISLPVVIEVGRLQMSVAALSQLQPGNLLELNARTEEGVDLVVQGKRIAHGELLQFGDVLGVRILEVG